MFSGIRQKNLVGTYETLADQNFSEIVEESLI